MARGCRHPRPEALLTTAPPTATELVLRIAQSRDREAFGELFDRFAPRLAGMFHQSGLAADVRDELIQEVLLRVWRKASQFDPAKASVEAWVFAIARNARTDHLRRPVSRARVVPLDPAYVDERAPHAEEEAVRRQQARDLHRALEDLPRDQADILEAAYFRHQTLRAIATDTGLALGTVKSRVRLAFARLRNALRSHA